MPRNQLLYWLVSSVLTILFGISTWQPVFSQDYLKKAEAETVPLKQVELYTKAIAQNPSNWAYYKRGFAYLNARKYYAAIEDFKQALIAKTGNLDPAYIYHGFGYGYYIIGQYQPSIEACNKGIQLNPAVKGCWYIRAWSKMSLAQFAEAIADFQKYIELAPNEPSGYSDLAWAYYQKGDYPLALNEIEKALRMAPENRSLVERKVLILNKLGKKDEAEALAAKITNYVKDDPISLSNLGVLFANNRDYKTAVDFHSRAIALYNEKIKIDPRFPQTHKTDLVNIYMNRGNAYYGLKDYQHALADYTKVIDLDPTNYLGWQNIGQVHTYQKNWKEGVLAYEQCFRYKPDYSEGWVNLGFCYSKMHKDQEAVNAYTRGLRITPNVGLLYNNRGFSYLLLKQYDKCYQDLLKAIEVDPTIAMSHISLGEYYNEVGKYDEAIAKFNEALGMPDKNENELTAGYTGRGTSYLKKKQFDPAESDFQKALNVDPEYVEAHEKIGITFFEKKKLCDAQKHLKQAIILENTQQTGKATECAKYLGKITAINPEPCR